ncbi:PREDICTED: pentatricopeptide repeat-containing protein At2g06000-like isoform X2 [Tarenaya hassleriana]|uniref:pentatricopeptide repeat-containing protein At2g06000-like isoform X2 n=1 Tax=Tarenaya hassleriana TaxID=28532 RepID=UPI00053C3F3A|nr:PREDICTED: pentatricopeptide repeat-containing protein At2g06000-like isoform X2 [Tarenaya hassleriana]
MIRASFATAISHLHTHSHGISRARPLPKNAREVMMYSPESWLVKVVSTLFLCRAQDSDCCFCFLSKNLNPFIAFEVVKKLENPELSFRFWEFSRFKLNILHSFWTYNMLARSLCNAGFHDLARKTLECMRSDGVPPDSRLLGFLVPSFAEKGNLDFAKTLLVQSYEVEGEVGKTMELFGEMGSFGCSPDTVTYNTLIKGLCDTDDLNRAKDVFDEVKSRSDCSPNVVTYTSMMSGYCKVGKMRKAFLLLAEMIDLGINPNCITFNVLIDGFVKAGEMPSAESILGKMIAFGCCPDVVTFTSLIDGYCRAGKLNRGMKLWGEMSAKGLDPNGYTYSILINALCKANRLKEASELLRELSCKNIIPKPFMFNPVIDGFCKSGNINEANEIVAEMEMRKCNPDKVTFTILMIGHCMKGKMFEAISIFHKMLSMGCSPDKITMNSLVSCLLKAGMPKEAYRLKKVAMENPSDGETAHVGELKPSKNMVEVPVAS